MSQAETQHASHRDRLPYQPVADVINLIEPASQQIFNLDVAAAERLLLSDQPEDVLGIAGSFALLARHGEQVRMARSLDRPMRYFLAKAEAGPVLIVAERIDEIRRCLEEHGYGDQFHPSYTRMVPAHHVTTLRLIGCPDPNPVYRRFFDPPRATLEADLDVIGEQYASALAHEVRTWLEAQDADQPIGVLFSGGADSGATLLTIYHQLLELGHSPSRLKAFTLAVDGEGGDARQALEFLRRVDLEMLGETLEVPSSELDPMAAIQVIEDYKPLDVECATVALALLQAIRQRYPEWRLLADGDGGDENLKDYPIEENPELTIKSVVNNSMLYQEGWGVDAIKHSLTYSGGFSRGCVRTFAPARHLDFLGFSPFTRPAVIRVAEAIPFAELTQGDHQKLYALKGEVLRRGIARLTGIDMPTFPKCRFQHGAGAEGLAARFATSPTAYRQHFLQLNA
ncbi:MAG: asparagine synthase-related protein [Acidobacteriota bacterium]